ncbi:MAG: GAF domain-containing protein, partial [Thermoflexibacteraceae bacterium]
MKKILLFFFSVLSILPHLLFAQLSTGKVADEKGNAVGDCEVIINSRIDFTVNKQGQFQFMYPQAGIQTLVLNKSGYKLLNWNYEKDNQLLNIVVAPTIIKSIKGKLTDKDGKAITNARVIIDGLNSVNTTTTNAKGEFSFSFKKEVDQDQVGFIVEGTLIRSDECFWSGNQVIIKTINLAKDGNLMAQKNTEEPIQKPTPPVPDQNIDRQSISVIVYKDDRKPAQGVHVAVNGVMHQTDQQGTFSLMGASDSENFNFVVEEAEISTIRHSDNNVFIYLKKTYEPEIRKQVEDILKDTAVLSYSQYDYEEDFNRVVNQLELKKQLLFEKSEHIRSEMDLITAKLRRSGNISEDQKIELKTYLSNLEQALVKNDIAYEEAEGKMQTMVDKMKTTIFEKDSAYSEMQHHAEEVEGELRFVKIELLIAVILGIGMLILAVLMYRQSKKLSAQKKEIEQQKYEIEHAYSNIKIISEIGQEITATLEFKELLQTVNDNLSILLDASIFGVGVVNYNEDRIDFTDFIKDENIQRSHYEMLNDTKKLAAISVKQRKTIVIEDLEKEYKKYIHTTDFVVTADMPKSLIYMPLTINDQVIGVITVQSNNKSAYKDIDVKILQTLDNYITIAMSNISSFQEIKNKNRQITDSIRYAQTIQQAVLPNHKQFSDIFEGHFVLYKPKDIVSGDFYWLDHLKSHELINVDAKLGDLTFMAVVDCTGHGVPGGFMSMVANHLLSEIINVKHIYEPDVILNTLDLRVRESLKQYEKVNDDGMDLGLCRIAYQGDDVIVQFAGARRPLWYYQHSTQTFDMLKGDRASIGGMHR